MYVLNSYWGEAYLIVTYLINRVSYRILDNVSLIQFMPSLFSSILILQNIKSHIFGCVLFVHVNKKYRNKLNPNVVICIFLDYAPNKRGTNVIIFLLEFFVYKYAICHENVSYFTCPQS